MNTVKFYKRHSNGGVEIKKIRCWQPKPRHFHGGNTNCQPSKQRPMVRVATVAMERAGWTRKRLRAA